MDFNAFTSGEAAAIGAFLGAIFIWLVCIVIETLGGIDVIVPEYSQHIGAVGAALLVSGMGNRQDK